LPRLPVAEAVATAAASFFGLSRGCAYLVIIGRLIGPLARGDDEVHPDRQSFSAAFFEDW